MALKDALIIVALSVFASSCSVIEKIVDPVKKERKQIVSKLYEKDGLTFMYPDNWSVSDDTVIEKGIRHVIIEDSDSSIFVVQILSSDLTADLEDLAEIFILDVSKNIPIGKVSSIEKGAAERSIAGSNQVGVRRTYAVGILGEVVPHTVDFFLVEGSSSRAIITIQVPDEDSKAAEKEIKIISDSLKF